MVWSIDVGHDVMLLLVAVRCDVTVDDDNQMGWEGLESESSRVEGQSSLSCLVSFQLWI